MKKLSKPYEIEMKKIDKKLKLFIEWIKKLSDREVKELLKTITKKKEKEE